MANFDFAKNFGRALNEMDTVMDIRRVLSKLLDQLDVGSFTEFGAPDRSSRLYEAGYDLDGQYQGGSAYYVDPLNGPGGSGFCLQQSLTGQDETLGSRRTQIFTTDAGVTTHRSAVDNVWTAWA